MKRTLLNILGLSAMGFLASCGGDDPLPAPSANFTQDAVWVEVGGEITFTNSSSNATTFQWDFGDGQTSMEENPVVLFDIEGEFTVTLIAMTEDDQSDSVTADVFVGERVVNAVVFNSINFVRDDNTIWDSEDGTGPDLSFFYGTVDGFNQNSDDIAAILLPADISAANLPAGFELEGAQQLVFTNEEEWIVQLAEYDIPSGADPNNPATFTFEEMITLGPFNPIEFGVTDGDTGAGFLTVSGNGFDLDIGYQIVVDLNN